MKLYKIIFFATFTISISAQQLTFDTYINRVKENNISYIAEKYNVDIATANIKASKVFNDPELSFSYSNNQDEKLQMGQSYEGGLEYSFSLGNVRGAQIAVARAEKSITDAALSDYFRNLKAEASLAYLNALKEKKIASIMQSSYIQMNELAKGDSLRYNVGEITETDATQSRLEAQIMYNDLLQSEVDYNNSLSDLRLFMGEKDNIPIDSVPGDLSYSEKTFNLAELYETAEDNRTDLQVAINTKMLSEKNLRLVKANRAMELGLSFGFAHNTIVKNEIAPAPSYNGITAGISIPLKFSNTNRGEVHAAQFAIKQSETKIEAARLQIHNEVTQAYNNYIAACTIAKRFNGSMLTDAANILKNKTYGYQRGETSLMEVINARRSYNEINQSYCEAIFNAEAAFIELQKTIGM